MAEPGVDIVMDPIDGDFTDDYAADIAYEEEQQQSVAYSASVEEMERRLDALRADSEDDSQRNAIRAIQQQQQNELAFDHFTKVFRSRGYVLQKQDRIDLAAFRAGPKGSKFATWDGIEIELTTVKNKSKLKAEIH